MSKALEAWKLCGHIMILSVAAVLAGFWPVGDTYGQNIPHDPDLMDKLWKEEYAAIAKDEVGAFGLAAAMMGFSDSECQLAGQAGQADLQEVMWLSKQLTQEVGPNYFLIKAHPTYQQAVLTASHYGCSSFEIQKLMGNLVACLRFRYSQ
ncbi:hypothetical protein NG726_11350 [Pseudomonas sp. MOB-449]|nr:hypothetical protein [Pseudomonas sp. MOB-449]